MNPVLFYMLPSRLGARSRRSEAPEAGTRS
jgi:hypothetical protein